MSTLDAFKKVMGELRAGKFHPVYLLHGEEPFFIDRISGELEHTAVEEHARDFDLTVVYGRDTDPESVRDTCLRYPMMGERQLVVLREAQSWRIDQLEKLEPYVRKPIPSTVLVICYKHKKVDGRRSFAKTLAKSGGMVFTSDKLRDDQLPGWVQKYVAHMGRKIGQTETRLLADHLGSDLGKVAMEVEKLCLVTEGGGTDHRRRGATLRGHQQGLQHFRAAERHRRARPSEGPAHRTVLRPGRQGPPPAGDRRRAEHLPDQVGAGAHPARPAGPGDGRPDEGAALLPEGLPAGGRTL